LSIFDIIDGIAFSKKPALSTQAEDDKDYQPYLVNRWLSMLDTDAAKIINETLNKVGHVLSAPEQYKFLVNVLPRYKRQRINYIKKPAKEKT
jgi:hypothetical protein